MQKPFTRRQILGLGGTVFAGVLSGCASSGEGTPDVSAPSPAEPSPSPSDTPPPPSPEATDEASLPEPSDVSFESSTGATVKATVYGRGSCGIVLVPQVNLDRESWQAQAEHLAEAGVVALPIDEGSDEVPAVLAAVEYLRTEHDTARVVVMGASSGGEAAVLAAARKPDRVDGVIALSPAGGVVKANRLTGQQLFVVGSGDEQRFVDTARELADRASEPKHLKLYESEAHGQRLFESPHRQDLWTNVLALTTNVCQNR